MVRDKIQLEEQSAKAEIIDVKTKEGSYRIGVIEIPAFYLDVDAYHNRDPNFKSTTKDVLRLLGELEQENVNGIILDLRNNGGGFLQEATTLTDLFIDPGPIVQVQDSGQVISRNYRSRAEAYYRGPLVVLINRLSASASEIFAGAIQDYGRGLVVGGQSFGKGTVQVQLPVREGQLKLTESKFYRVSGNSTQHLGVVPDVTLPSYYNIDKVGESSEDNALPWDSIPAAPHRRYNLTLVSMQTLQERHEYRLQQDPDLVHLNDELVLMKERQKLKQLSLNEEKRRAEVKEYDDIWLTLENKRRVAKAQPPYATIEELRAVDETEEGSKEKSEEEKSTPLSERDPLLYETGNIISDYIDLTKPPMLRAKQP
ncbi:MAG: carboxyl-terminal processing protease [Porticoccus sp.]